MNIQNLKCLLETAESNSVLSGNRPSICGPCQYVQNTGRLSEQNMAQGHF